VAGLRRRFLTLLDEQAQLERMARIIGKDALPARQRVTLWCAELVNEAFLRQSAFSEIDRVCSPARQAAMMKLLGRCLDLADAALAAGATPEAIAALPCMRAVQRMGEEIGDGELPKFAELQARLERDFAHITTPRRPPMRLTVEGAATRLEGPLLFMRRTVDVGLADAVEVTGRDGRVRLGRVAAIDEDIVTLEVLENTAGLSLEGTVVRLLGEPLTFSLGPGVLGRVFNGVGQVIDGGPPIAAHRKVAIEGLPMNPVARALPRDFIETGVSTLDLMNSLVRGQKLPLFSGGGLPHDRLAVEIAAHARLRKRPGCGRLRDRLRRHRRAATTAPSTSAAAWSRAGRWNAPRCSSTWPAIRARSAC
jgi:hypothetical protein